MGRVFGYAKRISNLAHPAPTHGFVYCHSDAHQSRQGGPVEVDTAAAEQQYHYIRCRPASKNWMDVTRSNRVTRKPATLQAHNMTS